MQILAILFILAKIKMKIWTLEHEKIPKICWLKLKLKQIHNLWKSITKICQKWDWTFFEFSFLFADFAQKKRCDKKKNYSQLNDEYSITKYGCFNRNMMCTSVCMQIVFVLTSEMSAPCSWWVKRHGIYC